MLNLRTSGGPALAGAIAFRESGFATGGATLAARPKAGIFTGAALCLVLAVTMWLFARAGQAETVLIIGPGNGFRVSNADRASEAPRLEFIGAVNNPSNPFDDVRWAVVWADERLINGLPGRAVFYRAINPFNWGQFPETWVSDALRLSGENAGEPDLAWNGSRVGVAYNEEDALGYSYLLFSSLFSSGGTDDLDVIPGGAQANRGVDYGRPRLDNDGSRFGIFWEGDSKSIINAEETFYVEVNADGSQSENFQIASGGAPVGQVSGGDMLTLPGSDYAVVWPHFERNNPSNLDMELYFARLDDNNGVEVTRRLTNTAEHSLHPQIAWDGGGRIAVVWDEFAPDSDFIDVFFMLIDTSGNQLRDRFNQPVFLDLSHTTFDSLYPTVAWNGEFWLVVWQEGQGGLENLMFAIVEPDGVLRQGPDLLMDPQPPQTGLQRPHLVWDGKLSDAAGAWTIGLVFQARLSDSNSEIYFSEIWPDRTAWMLR
ncbi:MAG: hypothetical protein Kow0059_20950 [Candidatus Sumerlaeia bacterium]